jgi:MFS family permease
MTAIGTAPPETAAPASDAEAGTASAAGWYALFVLTMVLIFATVDRAILSLLAEEIKKTLSLTDLQLGLMQATGISLLMAAAAFPMAWLSDRWGRRATLALAMVWWSAAVVACGLAQNFTQLLVASALVGAGEAAAGPVTYSLIAEFFTGRKRQTANSVFVVAAAAGGGAALAIAGQLINWVDLVRPHLPADLQSLEGWRLGFLLAATPVPLMVLLVATVRPPQLVAATPSSFAAVPTDRNTTAGQLQSDAATNLTTHLRLHGGFLLRFFLGIGATVFGFSAIAAWLPVLLIRIFSQTPAQVGASLGTLGLVGTGVGFVITAFGLRYLVPQLGGLLQIRVIWVGVALVVFTAGAMGFASSATAIYAIQTVQLILFSTATMLFPTVVQGLAPTPLRGRVMALQSIVVVCLSAAAAPLVGLVSDALAPRPDALLVAASGISVCALVVAAVLLWRCERGYVATVEAIDATEAKWRAAQAASGQH